MDETCDCCGVSHQNDESVRVYKFPFSEYWLCHKCYVKLKIVIFKFLDSRGK